MRVSNANLLKKMVSLSFNTVTIWPCLRHVRKSFRPSTQHNLSRLPSSETVLSRHSQRNGTSEELDAAVGHFFFYFSMVRRPQLFSLPIRGGMNVEPSKEEIDRVTLEDARVSHEQLAEMP